MKKRDMNSNVNDQIRAKNRRALLEDVGLLFFLAGLLAAALLVSFADSDVTRMENLIMFLVLSGAVILAAFRFHYLAVILSAVQTCFYAAYKIYVGFMVGGGISIVSYAWLFVPMLTVVSMVVFMRSTYQAEVIAEMLEKQLRDQVMVDRVTGLYNLKSMYIDLERQIAFSKRNVLPLSLIILELRYKDELTSILTSAQFDALRVTLARLLEDSIRLEDRLYALDEEGRMGIICTCSKDGAELIKSRLINKLEKTDQFRGILNRALRVEIRVGIYEYQEGAVENAIDLKKKAENEMQYDV
ncbi:MAG: GGDEF domain-containing protein [Faecousia sp.]